jgi:peptidyl-prolyl cis-trans isomerase B (cyclophilin B)
VSVFPHKELIGNAEPADPNDNLDVTAGETKQSEKQPEKAVADVTPSTESPGLSLLTKLIFFGVIVGVIFTFLKSRKGSVTEKNLA